MSQGHLGMEHHVGDLKVEFNDKDGFLRIVISDWNEDGEEFDQVCDVLTTFPVGTPQDVLWKVLDYAAEQGRRYLYKKEISLQELTDSLVSCEGMKSTKQ